MRTIKLTDSQYQTLTRLLDYEFDSELNYQESGDCDTELLEEYFDLYKAVEKPRNFIEGLVYEDICKNRQEHIDYLKHERKERYEY